MFWSMIKLKSIYVPSLTSTIVFDGCGKYANALFDKPTFESDGLNPKLYIYSGWNGQPNPQSTHCSCV